MAGRPKGLPKSGGRQKGTPNKITADIKEIAQSFGEEAITYLVEIARNGDAPPAARVAAVKEILDRGYGKAKQDVELTGANGGPVETVTRIELVALGDDSTDSTAA